MPMRARKPLLAVRAMIPPSTALSLRPALFLGPRRRPPRPKKTRTRHRSASHVKEEEHERSCMCSDSREDKKKTERIREHAVYLQFCVPTLLFLWFVLAMGRRCHHAVHNSSGWASPPKVIGDDPSRLVRFVRRLAGELSSNTRRNAKRMATALGDGDGDGARKGRLCSFCFLFCTNPRPRPRRIQRYPSDGRSFFSGRGAAPVQDLGSRRSRSRRPKRRSLVRIAKSLEGAGGGNNHDHDHNHPLHNRPKDIAAFAAEAFFLCGRFVRFFLFLLSMVPFFLRISRATQNG